MRYRVFLATVGMAMTLAYSQQAVAQTRQINIDDLLEAVRTKHDLPALAAAVILRGEIVAAGAVGVRKIGADVPVTIDDQFHLGSCSKSMSATVAAMLVEEGRLSWDTTLAMGLPDLAPKIHPDLSAVTLAQLLAHRAGLATKNSPQIASLRDLLEAGRLGKTPRQQRYSFCELIVQEKPALPPGTKFVYSNRGYVLAGAMMERAANAAWEDLMTARLFQPLGMTTAGFGSMGRPDKIDQPWQHSVKDGVRRAIAPGPLSDNPPAIGPAGTIHCSIGDWAKYALVHLQGAKGKNTLLATESFKQLHTPHFGDGYGYGWFVAKDGTLSHAGSNGRNFAQISIMPRTNFAVLIVTNQGGEVAVQACSQLPSMLLARCARN